MRNGLVPRATYHHCPKTAFFTQNHHFWANFFTIYQFFFYSFNNSFNFAATNIYSKNLFKEFIHSTKTQIIHSKNLFIQNNPKVKNGLSPMATLNAILHDVETAFTWMLQQLHYSQQLASRLFISPNHARSCFSLCSKRSSANLEQLLWHCRVRMSQICNKQKKLACRVVVAHGYIKSSWQS